ncbi:MAG TPA: RpiB/LacA/LacB family sugar-phosphate isomerase [Anaerolineales bacterium]|nr:RpiB/LacA/LacB family sugar-phosphate isomerase [Anaerolineales bacterium]
MKLSVGADEKTPMAEAVLADLQRRGHELTVFGPLAGEKMLWPSVARRAAETVARGEADEGVLFCWTGTGVSLAANKVPGIRAVLCADAETARGARLWNKANVLCLSLRRTAEVVGREILDAWFNNAYKPNPEDDEALRQIEELESTYRSGPAEDPVESRTR